MIEFVVCMEPLAKGRPRFWNGRVLTDKNTRRFEREFAVAAKIHRPTKPLAGPLQIAILFQVKRPKSVTRDHPCVRPDLDNYIKAVTDAMNGEFWKDDAQIIRIYARKCYGAMPLIKVEITKNGHDKWIESADAPADFGD